MSHFVFISQWKYLRKRSVHQSLCWMELRETFKAKSWIARTSTALGSYSLRLLLSNASSMHCCKWLATSYTITSPTSVLSPATFALTTFPQKIKRIRLHVCWWMGSRYVMLVGKCDVTDTKQTVADGFSEGCYRHLFTASNWLTHIEKTVSIHNAQTRQHFNCQFVKPLHWLSQWWMIRWHFEGSVHKGSISRNPNFSGNEFLCFASFTS